MFDFQGANENQRVAITSTEGPLLITAGPGTGKTFTLVMRALYLIAERGVQPDHILLATFTEKAAKELVTRLSNALLDRGMDIDLTAMYVGTFHSICLRIIKEHIEHTSLRKGFRVADTFDQQYLVFRNIAKFRELPDWEAFPAKTGAWNHATEVCRLANILAEELIDLEAMKADEDPKVRSIAQAAELYNEILSENNWLDFSNIQVEAYRLLTTHPEVLKELRSQLSHFMVDEYQDTNYIQEQIAFLLSEDEGNICVVGDDDQGLYRFRGATIRNILEFPHKFPEGMCKVVPLSTNYRSDKAIVDFYNEWMATTSGRGYRFDWGQYRYDKAIVAARPQSAGASAVSRITVTPGMADWGDKIVALIKGLKASGKISDYNQVAFLTRSVKNDRVVALAEQLEEAGISVYSPRSDTFFYRDEVRLALGFLILAFPKFVIALEAGEIKYVSDEYVKYLEGCVMFANAHIEENDARDIRRWVAQTGRYHMTLRRATDYAYSGLLYQMFQYDPFKLILDLDMSLGVHDLRPLHNLSTLVGVVNKYEYLHRVDILTPKQIDKETMLLFGMFLYYLWRGGIAEYEDDEEYLPSGCVPFLTIHQSKGMEFPFVIINTTNQTPTKSIDESVEAIRERYGHRKQFEPLNDIKYFDFWRLYYTAFSRAQDALVLATARDRDRKEKCFDAIYEELPEANLQQYLLSGFDFHRVKSSALKPSFSFTSHVAVYEACPRQYKFYNELEFPQVRVGATLFGQLVHSTIEDVHKAVLRGEADEVTPDNVSAWFDANYDSLSKSQHSYLSQPPLEAARRQVLLYVERQQGTWDRIREAEVSVNLVKPDYVIAGKVDLIRGEGDTVELVDFKAEKKPDLFNDRERIDNYRRQLQLYAYLVEQSTGHRISKMHLYYTGEESGVPTITFSRDRQSIDATVAEFDRTVRKIMQGDFEHCAKKTKQCENCDFRYYCGN